MRVERSNTDRTQTAASAPPVTCYTSVLVFGPEIKSWKSSLQTTKPFISICSILKAIFIQHRKKITLMYCHFEEVFYPLPRATTPVTFLL